jgi:hypothetical protein
MIKGSYSIYKNNQLVVDQDNVVTNFGKDAIWKYLAGAIPEWGGAIAVGAGTATVAATNTRLDFEFARNATLLKSPVLSGSDRVIILKTSLEPNVSGVIKEIGIYNTLGPTNPATFDGRLLTQFSEGVNLSGETDPLEWTHSATTTADTTNSKIGSANVAINGTGGTVASTLGGSDTTRQGFLSIDLTKYSPLDSLEIAYSLLTAISATGKTMKITLYDNQQTPVSISKEWTFGNPTSTGDYSNTATLSEFTVSPSGATFNYEVSIIKIETNANVSFDAIRIDDTDSTDTTYGLVSRAVLSTPITKKAGDSIDIEYKLTLGL